MTKTLIQRLAFIVLIIAAGTQAAQAQETPDSLLGSFEGPLIIGRDNMNLAFTFSMSEGSYQAAITSGSMGIYGMPATLVEVNGLNVKIGLPRLDAEFTGTLRLDESGEKILRIDGDWFQQSEMVPVVLLPVESPAF